LNTAEFCIPEFFFMLSDDLLAILACPACDERPPVRLNEAGTELVCERCGRRYPVRDDIPVMLVDEALPPVGGEVAEA
jgi:uncharacterized protein YbaR (Trm112 family)